MAELGLTCVACQGTRWRPLWSRLGAAFIRCRDCGLIRTATLPDSESLTAHYAHGQNYAINQQHAVAYDRIFTDLVWMITGGQRPSPGQTWLDIGCFTGRLLDLVRSRGYRTAGVEFQPEAASAARSRGHMVAGGAIESLDAAQIPPADVITAVGVIEHLVDPEALLRLARQVARPGASLVIETPNTSSLPARVLGRYWPPVLPIEHLHYFSATNLGRLLRRHGFGDVRVRRHWKRLPLGYVYAQFQTFGPEFHRALAPLVRALPTRALDWPLPFYVGEMLVIAERV